MTTSSGQQTQTQSAQSSPWQPTQSSLESIISQLGQQNTGVTGNQSSALQSLIGAAGGIPNLGGVGLNAVNQTGTNTGNLTGAYGQLQSALSPYLSQSYLNPMTTPGLSTQLQGLGNQISSNINGEFAAAGRDLSPANSQATAYGLAQGMAPILTNQYNTNVANQQNAAGALFGGANTLNSGINQNLLTALGGAGAVPGLATGGANAQLGAANTANALPYGNIGNLLSEMLPIAGLGGQTSGTGQTNATQTASPLSSLASLFGGQYSPFSGMSNAAGGILGGIGNLF